MSGWSWDGPVPTYETHGYEGETVEQFNERVRRFEEGMSGMPSGPDMIDDLSYVMQNGMYSNSGTTADDIRALFEGMELPHFTPPDSAYIKDLEEWAQWQDFNRRGTVEAMRSLKDDPPYLPAATARNQQYIGDSPGNIADYFGERGITPAGQINADIQGAATTQQGEAQSRIQNKSDQLQLATIERMMQTVGNPAQAYQSQAVGGLQGDLNATRAIGNQQQAAFQSFQAYNPMPSQNVGMPIQQGGGGGFNPMGGAMGAVGGAGSAWLGGMMAGAPLGPGGIIAGGLLGGLQGLIG